MDKKISHAEATALEYIVRSVFNCERFGVMGVADADHLERCPLDAAMVVFAPLYKNKTEISEIEEFMDRNICQFSFDDYEYDEKKVEKYIEELRKLVKKYY